jgi:hypothetical protein
MKAADVDLGEHRAVSGLRNGNGQTKLRVLIACERSGAVRDAFAALGHDAWSCDLVPSETPGNHIVGDVLECLDGGWDLLIAHPPCTFLCSTGARWLYDARYPNRFADRERAAEFVFTLAQASIARIAIENPIGYLSTAWRQPDQIIQPFWFGDDASKATCLWLKNLRPLRPTNVVEVSTMTTSTGKRFSTWYWNTSRGRGEARQQERSKTFQGIADAMARQWSQACDIQVELAFG